MSEGAGRAAPARRPRTALGPGGEFDWIRRFVGEGGTGVDEAGPVRVGPGDDAAVLDGGWVLTCDLTVEDVHFRRAWLEPREAAYRAVVVALSDLAAMAAEPVGALVSIAVSREDEAVLEGVRTGVAEACAAYGAPLLGGDLSRTPGPLVLDVVGVGRAERPLLRSGARPGDHLWVTGWLGGAGGAVRAWEDGGAPRPALREAFARPPARVAEARWLAGGDGVRAGLDLSDGLSGDAGHLAAASGVAVILDLGAVPIHPALVEDVGEEEALRLAIGAGEDYELLVAAAPGSVEPRSEAFRARFGIPLTRVGRVEAGEGVHAEGPQGAPRRALEGGGFSHFGSPDG